MIVIFKMWPFAFETNYPPFGFAKIQIDKILSITMFKSPSFICTLALIPKIP
jgi:hypothetical protein